MPIRFRCVYCNQLLGISRRKAGTIVRCTTCEGQLIVPDPNDPVTTEPAEPKETGIPSIPPPAGHADGGRLFERDDFDAILEPLAAVASPPAPPAKSKRSSTSAPPAPVGPAPPKSAPVLVLTRQRLTIVSVVLVLGLGLAFAGGLLLGLSLR
jgi:hypothetical protein